MNFCEIRPFVRFAQSITPGPANCGRFVLARDCRLFYARTEGARFALKDGREWRLEPGDCLYVPAGTAYRIALDGETRPLLLIVNFDFTWEHAAAEHSLPLLREGEAGEIFAVPRIADAAFFEDALFFSKIPQLLSSLEEMEAESAEMRLFSAPVLGAKLLAVLALLCRARLSEPARPECVERMIRYIRENYARPLDNGEIASAVSYHPNYANALFLRHTGQTLRQYLIGCRIQRALELLLSTDLSVTAIAAQTGFSSLSRFTREFARRTGNPPSRYRQARAEK